MYNKIFNQLHHQSSSLLLGNVWDVNSALLFQKAGFRAIGTSSAAIAESQGYEDGEKIPFNHLLEIIKQIQNKISIPLTVDLEAGYSQDIDIVCENIYSLVKLNVAGINIEDSIVSDKRSILSIEKFRKKIKAIKDYLLKNDMSIFLNIRTDPYIMGLDAPLQETIKRIQAYEKLNIDGIFIPCIEKEDDIKQVVNSTNIPINVMTMPNLPGLKVLEKIGVKRVSMGPFIYNHILKHFEKNISTILKEQSFDLLFR